MERPFEAIEENPYYEGVFDILPEELSLKLHSAVLIDVRQPEEFNGELGHVPGSKLIVLQTLPEQVETFSKDDTIVFVCRSGDRSARATAFLQEHGFMNVYNMKGGMLRWNALELPTEKDR